MVFGAAPAHGQIFQLEGGTSSLYQAHGGSLGFRTSRYDGWIGLGSLDGLRFGAFMRTKVRGSTLTFGDDAIPFQLGTDVFDSSHYLMGRGVGWMQERGGTRIFAFGGATSLGLGTPYFRAAENGRGVGLLFLDRPLRPNLSVFSRTVSSSRQTFINGLEWAPRPGMRAAVAAGLGGNQGYSASSVTIDREWATLKAAYIRAGNQFRRIVVEQPLSSEVDRENVLLALHPTPFLTVSAGRQNFLQPNSGGGPAIRGSVNQYAAALSAARVNVSGSLFDSRVLGFSSRGASFAVGRDFFGRLQVNGNYLWNRPGHGRALTSLLGIFRETISPRLSLLQLVNHSQGRTTISYGGNLVSNRISIGIEYQTLYLPFQTGNQFKQALILSFQLRPFGNVQLNAGSFVAPDGTVRYTAYGGTFLYHGELAGTPPVAGGDLFKYLVRGRVTDEAGKPIRGAALRIDGGIAFSDSNGRFFVRKKKPETFRLEVLLDQFIVPGAFEVVSAPANVQAQPDDVAREWTVVLRRVTAAPHPAGEAKDPSNDVH